MTTREEALAYGMSFRNAYTDRPFHDDNWVLVRCKKNKKAFLWTYEYEGQMRINIKTDPEWRDFWRDAFPAVLPGYHQNKEHWNTVILDGTVPDETLKKMIAESYELVAGRKNSVPKTRRAE
ncbi:MAG: MmcQ/YjbR family DNA-binding protein [Lachnospiraceae bacterium]|nr:MmcQ/YjbR family DNA-binding protein [Lachnospiraceae bacterium]